MDAKTIETLCRKLPAKILPSGNLRTGPVRLSYPFLFQKAKPYQEGQEPRFMSTLLFPACADLELFETEIARVAADKWGSNWQRLRVTTPLRNAEEMIDDQGELKPGFEPGSYWFRATSTKKPGVVDRAGETISDAGEIYGGCWALVTLRAYVPNTKEKRVVFGLQNVQKILDDEKLGGGGASAKQEFEAIDGLDDLDAAFAADQLEDEIDLG